MCRAATAELAALGPVIGSSISRKIRKIVYTPNAVESLHMSLGSKIAAL